MAPLQRLPRETLNGRVSKRSGTRSFDLASCFGMCALCRLQIGDGNYLSELSLGDTISVSSNNERLNTEGTTDPVVLPCQL